MALTEERTISFREEFERKSHANDIYLKILIKIKNFNYGKIFTHVPMKRPGTNVFDLSHERKLSMKMGNLVPIMLNEVVPGDKFQINTEILMRMAPMLAPIMHRLNVYTHYFFVPTRLVWDDFEEFITGGRLGPQPGVPGPVPPFFQRKTENRSMDTAEGTLADYMGIPPVYKTGTPATWPVDNLKWSALPFRAYQLIYNEYYRDQNLEAEIPIVKTSGEQSDFTNMHTMRSRAWEKDYFTSALPWPQRGGDVHMALGDSATIKYDKTTGKYQHLVQSSGTAGVAGQLSSADDVNEVGNVRMQALNTGLNIDPNDTLFADLSDAKGGTINELRRAMRLQEWLEKNARGGARYVEQILSHFGVRSSDARLQRPEYLGGGKTPVKISEVLQTSETDSTAQGNASGHGLATGVSHQAKRFFEEHGYIIGIMSVLPRTSYQQGMERLWYRNDRFDYYWPEFANIGEQPVLNKELYCTGDEDIDNGTFGYQSRYAELKTGRSSVHGEMRSSLSYWHMGRIFSSAPALNSTFVIAKPTRRIFPVVEGSEDHLYVHLYNNIKARRPMPKFGVPTL